VRAVTSSIAVRTKRATFQQEGKRRQVRIDIAKKGGICEITLPMLARGRFFLSRRNGLKKKNRNPTPAIKSLEVAHTLAV